MNFPTVSGPLGAPSPVFISEIKVFFWSIFCLYPDCNSGFCAAFFSPGWEILRKSKTHSYIGLTLSSVFLFYVLLFNFLESSDSCSMHLSRLLVVFTREDKKFLLLSSTGTRTLNVKKIFIKMDYLVK